MSPYKNLITSKLDVIQLHLNEALTGKNLRPLEAPLKRMNPGGALPVWFSQLATAHTLPNLDDRNAGGIIKKLLIGVLEKYVLEEPLELHLVPTGAVTIPELELGVKTPSENFCTIEPYFSAYERLTGTGYDTLVLQTSYQDAKQSVAKNHGLKERILDVRYLRGSEIADLQLCEIAENLKRVYADREDMLRRAINFLAYANPMDWESAHFIDLLQRLGTGDLDLEDAFWRIRKEFMRKNRQHEKKGRMQIPPEQLEHLERALTSPDNVVLQAEEWVMRTLNEHWHAPSRAVWDRILTQPLEGKIGMTYMLQWQYHFGTLFRPER